MGGGIVDTIELVGERSAMFTNFWRRRSAEFLASGRRGWCTWRVTLLVVVRPSKWVQVLQIGRLLEASDIISM